MRRIHIICEGQTEETFVNKLLRPEFLKENIALYPSLIGSPGHKGGNFKIERLLKDTEKRLKGDKQAYCSTFFDYYGLPNDFPGRKESSEKVTIIEKATIIQEQLKKIVEDKFGDEIARRFIPYVQMYEFEALLFSDTEAFARSVDQPQISEELSAVRNAFSTPEDINDSKETAPSKRILKIVADSQKKSKIIMAYQKPVMGTNAAQEIGLAQIRNECKLFDEWLKKLEKLKPVNI